MSRTVVLHQTLRCSIVVYGSQVFFFLESAPAGQLWFYTLTCFTVQQLFYLLYMVCGL